MSGGHLHLDGSSLPSDEKRRCSAPNVIKLMMLFLMPTPEDDFEGTKDKFDKRYGSKTIHLNNFAQAFSIACWFIKDSCISATHIYWLNLINGYYSQGVRDMNPMLSDGTIAETSFNDDEMQEALERMFEIYRYLLPDDAHTGSANMTTSGGDCCMGNR